MHDPGRLPEVGLTEQQAVTATAQAARSLDRADPVPDLARHVAAALPEVASATGSGGRLARALLGYDGPTLSCVYGRAVLHDQRVGRAGLTPRGERLRREIRRAFADLPMGGFAAGGVSTGHVGNSAHYEGRAIDVFLRPHTDRAQARRGWVLSQTWPTSAESVGSARDPGPRSVPNQPNAQRDAGAPPSGTPVLV